MFRVLHSRTRLVTLHMFSKVTKTVETQGEWLCVEERF